MMAEGAELARDIGDRGMYYWLVGMTAVFQMDQGTRWDEHLETLQDAYESASIRQDRLRLRIFIGLIQAARGERLDEYLADITELGRGDSSKDDQLIILMTQAHVAMRRHQYAESVTTAMEAFELQPQNPEIPLLQGLTSAMRSRAPQLIRAVAHKIGVLPSSGVMAGLQKGTAQSALAAADGRIGDAVSVVQAVLAEFVLLGQRYVS